MRARRALAAPASRLLPRRAADAATACQAHSYLGLSHRDLRSTQQQLGVAVARRRGAAAPGAHRPSTCVALRKRNTRSPADSAVPGPLRPSPPRSPQAATASSCAPSSWCGGGSAWPPCSPSAAATGRWTRSSASTAAPPTPTSASSPSRSVRAPPVPAPACRRAPRLRRGAALVGCCRVRPTGARAPPPPAAAQAAKAPGRSVRLSGSTLKVWDARALLAQRPLLVVHDGERRAARLGSGMRRMLHAAGAARRRACLPASPPPGGRRRGPRSPRALPAIHSPCCRLSPFDVLTQC